MGTVVQVALWLDGQALDEVTWNRICGHIYQKYHKITNLIAASAHGCCTYGMERLADPFRIGSRLPAQFAQLQLPQRGVCACHLLQSCPVVVPELQLVKSNSSDEISSQMSW